MMKKFWKHSPEKKIMLLPMIAVSVFLLVIATVAWFTMNKPVTIDQMQLRTADMGTLYVDVKILPYEVDLNQENIIYSEMMSNAQLKESGYATLAADGIHYQITRMSLNKAQQLSDVTIDMGHQKLNSIERDKLGPGAYGNVVFYIKSMNKLCTSYQLEINPKLTYAEHITMTEEKKEELQNLVCDHIRFYGSRSGSAAGGYAYSDRIIYEGTSSEAEGIVGTLVPEEEKEVEVYWYWPYEYTDIPSDSTPVSTTSTDIESYDLGDTSIGNYVSDITFAFTVTGDLYE